MTDLITRLEEAAEAQPLLLTLPPQPTALARLLREAAQALRTPPANREAVAKPYGWAWRQCMRDTRGGWENMMERKPPSSWVNAEDVADLQPLYTHPPQPDALPGDLREKVVRHLMARYQRNALGVPLPWERVSDYGKEHWLSEADAIISLIQAERGSL